MRKIVLILPMLLMVMIGCNKKYTMPAGKMKFTYLMVYNASNEKSESYVELDISEVYFLGENYIEKLPEYYTEQNNEGEYNIIKGDSYINTDDLDLVISEYKTDKQDLKNKKSGITFLEQQLEGTLKKSTDTILKDINYSRYILNTEKYYTVYYVKVTDTLLPFNLHSELATNGQLRRIDTYDKKEDIFSSLKMTVTDTIFKKEYELLKQMENEL